MATTTPDSLFYPIGTDAVGPLHTVLATMQSSVQAAMETRFRNVPYPVADASARNTRYPNPVQGNAVYRSDKGYTERYFGAYSATANPAGVSEPGWYPVDNLPLAYMSFNGSVASGAVADAQTAGAKMSQDADTVGNGVNAMLVYRSGYYQINATLNWGSNNAGSRVIEVTNNGNSFNPTIGTRKSANSATTHTLSAMVYLTAGDILRLRIIQDSGASLGYSGRMSLQYAKAGAAPV